MATPQPVPTYRKLYRDREDRVIAGVAAGLAEHLRVPVVAVRIALVLLLAASGFGALLYIGLWAVVPVRPRPAGTPRRRAGLQRLGFGVFAIGVLMLMSQLDLLATNSLLVGLVAVVGLGAGIIWHQADPQRRRGGAVLVPPAPPAPVPPPVPPVAAMPQARPVVAVRPEPETTPDRRWFLIRVVGGGLLMVVGIVGILGFFTSWASQNGRTPGTESVTATLLGLVFALLALTGLVLAVAPVLWRIFGQLRDERVARIREQERAEVAAVVHDQVLHTLALIQRNASDPGSVLRLARGQERSLRGWLYRPTGSPSERLAAALEQAAAEVEDAYGITVETVVVGDAEQDERVGALVAATREALVNAARHAGVATVSLYAEAEAENLTVFVRDRGTGFDLSTVGEDRHGVRGSIIGRMGRHGGSARVRSSPGEGTEVQLSIARGVAASRDTAGKE